MHQMAMRPPVAHQATFQVTSDSGVSEYRGSTSGFSHMRSGFSHMRSGLSHMRNLLLAFSFALATAATAAVATDHMPANVDEARLSATGQNAAQWLSQGRDHSEQRFSPLEQITDRNVGRLGLAWFG